jgi:isocitrate dehydrogenase kinase/phosphatase
VTRHDRVVFYDYDEIADMAECNFRRIPAPRSYEDEVAAEPYWSVGPNDVFPEQFARFLVSEPNSREIFLERHADLMDPAFWAGLQARLRQGDEADVYPYPEEIRFRR